MHKTTYLITGLVGLITLIGAGCTTQQTTNPSVNTAPTNTNSTVPVQGKYENSTYGFSLVFPETWGTIREKKQENNGGKIYAAIQLFGANDKAQFIKIQVVKNEDKNDPIIIEYPQKYLTENSTYSYYYTTDTEAYPNNELNDDPVMQKEIKEIIKTFTLTNKSTEPLTYSTAGVSVSVSKTTAPFDYTAEQLKANANDCGIQQKTEYLDKLIAKFSGTTKTIYNFKYTSESQAANTFVTILLPNKPGYTSLDQFKNDFNSCAAGENAYPKMLNKDWLLFENSCGSGLDDASGLPIGCDEVKKVVEPSLKLNIVE